MTVEEKKKAIEQLQNLNRSGIISDEEMLEKISKLDVDAQRSYRSERHTSETKQKNENHNKKSSGNSFVYMVLSCLALILLYCFIMGLGNSKQENAEEYNTANNSSISASTSVSSKSSSSSSSYVSKDDEATAISMAQVMVKNELKSPSTASFPWDFGEYTVKKSGDQYTVTGYVDAQNSFGVKIRTKFETCFTVEMVGTKYKGTKIYTLIYE